MRYFIISQPKSGTYLCANLLVEFGIVHSYMHISPTRFEKYDGDDLISSRRKPSNYTNNIPISESIHMIEDNNLAVGHLYCNANNKTLLRPFKKVLMLRNVDDIRRSSVNWAKHSGRPYADLTQRYDLSLIKAWEKEEDVFTIDFDELYNKHIDVIDRLQIHLFEKIKFDSMEAINNALSKNSLTKVSHG